MLWNVTGLVAGNYEPLRCDRTVEVCGGVLSGRHLSAWLIQTVFCSFFWLTSENYNLRFYDFLKSDKGRPVTQIDYGPCLY
jgi:hypothetical protein